jgi:hypothetical protein
MRGTRRVLPAGDTYYLTVDKNTLGVNQRLLREHGVNYHDKQVPPCWVQVNDDKQNKINCWHVEWDGPSKFVYGDPHICGAMMYLETTAELEIWV